jgi:hypothetical protein
MIKLSILGLILAFACTGEDTQPITPCQTVSISDANPIQFWPVDCATWNQSRPAGVHHYCFCQPFLCTDTIPVEVTDPVGSLVLSLKDSDDQVIGTVPITNGRASFIPNDLSICDKSITAEIVQQTSLPPFDNTWEEVSEGGLVTGWTLDSTPSISIDGPAGAEISKSTSFAVGAYKIHWKISVTNTGFSVLNILFNKNGLNVVDQDDVNDGHTSSGLLSGAGTFEGDFEFSLIDNADEIGVSVANFAANTKLFEILELSLEEGPADVLYRSDCLDIRTSHAETLVLEYTNHSNYAGIDYGSLTPDPSFNLRIPAVFFESRFPQEGEDFQTSSNEVISLNSQIKEQRLLSTARMPKYMHRKILLAISHQFVFIEGEYWIKGGENYEKKEKSNKRDSFDMYTCWLTRQDYVVRNIL